MTKTKLLLGWIGLGLGSSIGWWVGVRAGKMTGFFTSVIGSAIGLYLSRRFIREHFE